MAAGLPDGAAGVTTFSVGVALFFLEKTPFILVQALFTMLFAFAPNLPFLANTIALTIAVVIPRAANSSVSSFLSAGSNLEIISAVNGGCIWKDEVLLGAIDVNE